MNPVAKRTVTALAAAAAAVALFVWCPLKALAPIVIVLSALVQLEFYQMAAKYRPDARFGILLGFLWLAQTAMLPGKAAFAGAAGYGALALVFVTFAFAAWTMLRRRSPNPIGTVAVTLFGFFYVPFLLSFFLRVMQLGIDESKLTAFAVPATRTGLYTLLALIAVAKLSDMGGFAFGMAFGRHKMCPAVSPKKSWEGLGGSILGSVLMAALFWHLAQKFNWAADCPAWGRLTLAGAIASGAAIAVVGTLGDLVESSFKRECGVKDSATFMPAGLGGFLDMFDSILFVPALAYPFIAFYG